jgi:hypothetical protein
VRSRGGSGDCAKGVGFPPLRASRKRSHSSLRLSTVNLCSRASYRHGGRDPLPTDLVVTPLLKTLTEETSETRSPTDPDIEINPTFGSSWPKHKKKFNTFYREPRKAVSGSAHLTHGGYIAATRV